MRRTHLSHALELPVTQRRNGETRQGWVYRCVRERIEAGALRRGERLPSTRALAERWGVSRGIVELAFEQLTLEGYVAGRIGSGTEVIADLGDAQAVVAGKGKPTDSAESGNSRNSSHSSHPPPKPLPDTTAALALMSGRAVDTSLFPLASWRRHLNQVMKTITPAQLADTDPRGYLPLRESIARYLRVARGIGCEADDIVVTTGIRLAMDLVTEVLADDATTFYLEDPGYKSLSTLLRSGVPRAVCVPVDESGFDVEAAAAVARPGIAYVTPAHQAPLGMTMTINRRTQLLAWAHAQGVWIVEDDYDSEFSYGSAPLPALKAIDTHQQVIHCSSFNKTLFPSLRIGYLVAPPAVLARIVALRSSSGRANSVIDQMALARFIDGGDFARHLRASRSVYLRRRNLLIDTLRAQLRTPCRVSGEHAGFHCVLWLPPVCDEAEVVAALRAQDIHVEGLQEFSRTRQVAPGLVIGYAAHADERVKAGATIIARTIDRACR